MAGYQPRHDTDPVWFNGTQVNSLTAMSAQTGVLITAIHGWDERPDIRDVRENRSGQDGEYADNLYLGGRTITVEGEIYGSTWVNLQSRKRTLAATFNPQSTEVLLKIPDPATASPSAVYSTTGMTGYERASVRVIEAITFGDTLDPCCQTFQVVLRASDPHVYSDVATSTDSSTTGTGARTVTVDQSGTYPTPPTITVTGPTASTWSIQEPSSGLFLSMSGLTVATGETVEFDARNRTIDYTSTYEGVRILRSEIVALWMLDESAGTTADNEQGTAAYDGTYTGGYTLNQAGPVSGLASVDLNGSTGYVSVAHNNALFPSTFTFEGWVNFDSVAASKCIIDGVTSNRGWRLEWNGSAMVFTYGGLGATSASTLSAGSITTGTWYHIVVEFLGSVVRLYVNGVLTGSSPTATTYDTATSGGYRLGNRLDGSNDFDGKIAAFGIYSGPVNGGPEALYAQIADTSETSAYTYLQAASASWADLGTASSTYTLASSGLNTGSKLNITYRDARV